MSKRLNGYVCLVTGATRGIGKGIALQLGEAGATVYITGRTLQSTGFGSLKDTCAEIENRGGKCIPVACDHSDDEQVKWLFEQIEREQEGQLDCLVNNAFAAVGLLTDTLGRPYWQLDPAQTWDTVNDVGLRNHYLCATYATRMMVKRRRGLIVNVSSAGGMIYFINCCYGMGKAACDRMAADCSIELKPFGVAFVSLWPGAVRTELALASVEKLKERVANAERLYTDGESIEFAGKAVVALLCDPNVICKSGRVLLATDLATEYGFSDENGRQPPSMRCISYLLQQIGFNRLSSWIPNCLKFPFWTFDIKFSRFRCPDDSARKQVRIPVDDDANKQH